MSPLLRLLSFGLLWLGFVSYAFLLAPPDQPDTLTLIQNLSTGKLQGINPLVIALFNVMGIWPMIYSCVLLFDGRGQPLRAWPFALGSFALGAFALLPYLALRRPQPTFSGGKNLWLRFLDSRWLGLALLLGTLVLLGYGLSQGNWQDFYQQWQQSRFIHVMSLDFCLLSLLFPALLGDDLARRQISHWHWLRVIALVPLLGPLVYLCLRRPLPESLATATPTEGLPQA